MAALTPEQVAKRMVEQHGGFHKARWFVGDYIKDARWGADRSPERVAHWLAIAEAMEAYRPEPRFRGKKSGIIPSRKYKKRNPAHPKVARRAMAIAIAKARIRSWDIFGKTEDITQFFSQLTGMPVSDIKEVLWGDRPDWLEDLIDLFMKSQQDLINHRFMLPPGKDWVYVNHTVGLRAGRAYDYNFTKLIKKILREGVVPQPEGSGKYSECPGAVFGIGDYPRGQKWGDRLYNMRHFPWITFRVPKTQWAPRGGSVCTFSKIPAKDIVGICGIPASVMRKELGI